jgi:formiminotetrahydrofolate cyclodeaminase
VLRRGDEVISVDKKELSQFNFNELNSSNTCSLQVIRNGNLKYFDLAKKNSETYFNYFEVEDVPTLTENQKAMRKKWLKC